MPIYEYQCTSCGTRSEHLMRLSDPDPTECPGCDKPQLSRMLSAPQFRLAGGGWYETDFKGDKDKKRNLAGAESSSGGSSESKSDTSAPTSTPAASPSTASTTTTSTSTSSGS
jgi:putative FmdB family regulatory protein